MTTRNQNPLIDETDPYETASKLRAALQFLSGAMLSESTNNAQGREGCSLMLDMCVDAAAHVAALTHPARKT